MSLFAYHVSHSTGTWIDFLPFTLGPLLAFGIIWLVMRRKQ